jgi:hypothetical protein
MVRAGITVLPATVSAVAAILEPELVGAPEAGPVLRVVMSGMRLS